MTIAVVVILLYLREHTSRNSHHPQELGDIVTRVGTHASKNNEYVVCIEASGNLISFLFFRGHGSSDGGDVSIVPGVVIDKDCSVGHTSDLVSVIPPGHNFGVFRSVLLDPVICFSVVIDDESRAVLSSARHDNGWGTVSFGGEHVGVINVVRKSKQDEDNDHQG